MKKNYVVVLSLALLVSAPALAKNNARAAHKEIDRLEDSVEKWADKIEDKVESFAREKGLRKSTYKTVEKWEDSIEKHVGRIENAVERCAKRSGSHCHDLGDKVDMKEFNKSVANFRAAIKRFTTAHGGPVLAEDMKQFNNALRGFRKHVNDFTAKHATMEKSGK